MRISEIVGETAGVTVGEAAAGVEFGLPDDFNQRLAATQRKQDRRLKLKTEVPDTEAKECQQQHAAAEKKSRANDQLRALKAQPARSRS
jgi:hypothetical protein